VRFLKNRFPAATFHYHQWIEYNDASGHHFCEPELFVVLDDQIILFEVKLTGGEMGKRQLEGLYAPLLSFIFHRPVRCCLVCKWTTPDTPGPFFQTPDDFILSRADFGTWHWLPHP